MMEKSIHVFVDLWAMKIALDEPLAGVSPTHTG